MNAHLHYLLAQRRIADLQRAADVRDSQQTHGPTGATRATRVRLCAPCRCRRPTRRRKRGSTLSAPRARCSWQSRQITRSRAKGNKFRSMHRRQFPVAEATDLSRWIPAWVRIRLMLRSAVIDVHDVVREHDLAIVTPNDAFPPGSSIKPVGTTQLWPVLLDSREDREKHRNVAVVVGVAVAGDEVGDAVLGGKRGVMAFELPVGIREPVEGDYLSEGHAAR